MHAFGVRESSACSSSSRAPEHILAELNFGKSRYSAGFSFIAPSETYALRPRLLCKFSATRSSRLLPPKAPSLEAPHSCVGLSFSAIHLRMSNSVEYIFAAHLRIAEEAARKQGWHAYGRTGWIKPDGNEVHFICFEEQLAAIGKDETIYFVGALSPELGRFKQKLVKLSA
jgi:hypothetical protein